MLWIAWKLYHIFVLLKLNQTHAALLCARLFVPRVLCCCKTLQKVRSRTSPLRLLRLTVVVAQTRHTDYEACRDDAALEECDVSDEDHESYSRGDSWVLSDWEVGADLCANFPVSVVEDVTPNVPSCVDRKNNDHKEQQP
jgi:hypothetical protein